VVRDRPQDARARIRRHRRFSQGLSRPSGRCRKGGGLAVEDRPCPIGAIGITCALPSRGHSPSPPPVEPPSSRRSSPDRKGWSMRFARPATLALLAMLAASGCRTAGVDNLARRDTTVPSPRVDARALIAKHNRDAERIQSLEASPSLTVYSGRT